MYSANMIKQIQKVVGALLAGLLLASCGAQNTTGEPEQLVSHSPVRTAVQSNEPQFAPPAEGAPTATIETSKGTIKVLLFPQEAPLAVENFAGLAQSGVYNETEFHRVEKDFVIQGGDPTGTGKGGESIWGAPFKSEFSDRMHHYSGALCMAMGDDAPDTNLSQFYFVVSPQNNLPEEAILKLQQAGLRPDVVETYRQAGGEPYLDNKATVFGQVYEGMDVVDEIAGVAVDENARPKKPVKIISITIGTYSALPQVSAATSESGVQAQS